MKINVFQKWDVNTANSTLPNPESGRNIDYVAPNMSLNQGMDTDSEDEPSPSTPSVESSSILTSGRRTRKRPSNEVKYDAKMCEFMDLLIAMKKEPERTAFGKKVFDFTKIMENLWLKQNETVFDAFMIDCMRYTMQYNPHVVEITNTHNNSIIRASVSSLATFPEASVQSNELSNIPISNVNEQMDTVTQQEQIQLNLLENQQNLFQNQQDQEENQQNEEVNDIENVDTQQEMYDSSEGMDLTGGIAKDL